MPSKGGVPRTINTIEVDNVDEAAAKARAAGGTVVVPKLAIPGAGYLVYLAGPGGNIYGVMHRDPAAG
jgi:predicted enzyme related to lactoylglutathione lyase